jgi:Zn finger protein HypA/HybF involved in hydrogenase expression
MPVALKGCVILSQENKGSGSMVRYKRKCESCSWLDTLTSNQSVSNSKGTIFKSIYYCPKCKSKNEVQIQGS